MAAAAMIPAGLGARIAASRNGYSAVPDVGQQGSVNYSAVYSNLAKLGVSPLRRDTLAEVDQGMRNVDYTDVLADYNNRVMPMYSEYVTAAMNNQQNDVLLSTFAPIWFTSENNFSQKKFEVLQLPYDRIEPGGIPRMTGFRSTESFVSLQSYARIIRLEMNMLEDITFGQARLDQASESLVTQLKMTLCSAVVMGMIEVPFREEARKLQNPMRPMNHPRQLLLESHSCFLANRDPVSFIHFVMKKRNDRNRANALLLPGGRAQLLAEIQGEPTPMPAWSYVYEPTVRKQLLVEYDGQRSFKSFPDGAGGLIHITEAQPMYVSIEDGEEHMIQPLRTRVVLGEVATMKVRDPDAPIVPGDLNIGLADHTPQHLAPRLVRYADALERSPLFRSVDGALLNKPDDTVGAVTRYLAEKYDAGDRRSVYNYFRGSGSDAYIDNDEPAAKYMRNGSESLESMSEWRQFDGFVRYNDVSQAIEVPTYVGDMEPKTLPPAHLERIATHLADKLKLDPVGSIKNKADSVKPFIPASYLDDYYTTAYYLWIEYSIAYDNYFNTNPVSAIFSQNQQRINSIAVGTKAYQNAGALTSAALKSAHMVHVAKNLITHNIKAHSEKNATKAVENFIGTRTLADAANIAVELDPRDVPQDTGDQVNAATRQATFATEKAGKWKTATIGAHALAPLPGEAPAAYKMRLTPDALRAAATANALGAAEGSGWAAMLGAVPDDAVEHFLDIAHAAQSGPLDAPTEAALTTFAERLDSYKDRAHASELLKVAAQAVAAGAPVAQTLARDTPWFSSSTERRLNAMAAPSTTLAAHVLAAAPLGIPMPPTAYQTGRVRAVNANPILFYTGDQDRKLQYSWNTYQEHLMNNISRPEVQYVYVRLLNAPFNFHLCRALAKADCELVRFLYYKGFIDETCSTGVLTRAGPDTLVTAMSMASATSGIDPVERFFTMRATVRYGILPVGKENMSLIPYAVAETFNGGRNNTFIRTREDAMNRSADRASLLALPVPVSETRYVYPLSMNRDVVYLAPDSSGVQPLTKTSATDYLRAFLGEDEMENLALTTPSPSHYDLMQIGLQAHNACTWYPTGPGRYEAMAGTGPLGYKAYSLPSAAQVLMGHGRANAEVDNNIVLTA